MTIATLDQVVEDLHEQHRSALNEKETIILNMQHHIDDNLGMLTEHEDRQKKDDVFFPLFKWRELVIFKQLRKVQAANRAAFLHTDAQIPLAAAAAHIEALSNVVDTEAISNAADTEAHSAVVDIY